MGNALGCNKDGREAAAGSEAASPHQSEALHDDYEARRAVPRSSAGRATVARTLVVFFLRARRAPCRPPRAGP